MKICVTSISDNLEAQVDPRFGRCSYFVIVNSETMKFQAIPNQSFSATHGAGIQAVQTLTNMDIDLVITGNIGPNAFNAISVTGIKIITDASGSAREAVEKYKSGQLQETGNPTVGGHFGMRKGSGRGR